MSILRMRVSPPVAETPTQPERKKLYKVNTNDMGFGTKLTEGGSRMLNRDGSFNVKRSGMPLFQSSNLYHRLITMSWLKFNVMVLIAYLVINLSFATMYYLIGMHNMTGNLGGSPAEKFLDAFFFSAQTLTTVGYGRISPVGVWASVIAAIESLAGLLGFALATGLLYGRFSRPMAKILSSDNAIIAPYKDHNAFMFRIANERKNQLLDTEVQITFSRVEPDETGSKTRKFYNLKLERHTINFLALSWTIVHPVTGDSPLSGITEEQLNESNAEFIILLKAFDDTFSQTVHTRFSYKHYEIMWGMKFKPMFNPDSKGQAILHLNKIGDMEPAQLN